MPKGIYFTGGKFTGIEIFGIAIGSARSINDMEKIITSRKEKFLYCQGANMMVPGANPYRIFSPNGGGDWYAIDEGHRIIGTAEEVYPGLLQSLDALEAIKDQVRGGKTIDPASSQGRSLLERAGFTVVERAGS